MKTMTYFFLAILIGLLSLLLYLLLISPGKPKPFTDEQGKMIPESISEKLFVDIGGVQQGMFIRSKNMHNPVLLFVHGGPGFPNYYLFDQYKPGLEDYFTVCYWEQRGGGLSWSPEIKPESMTLAQLSSDAIEVTNYLRKRFRQEKIYIMAWSGGTAIALPAISKAPELYHAYLAMAQIAQQPVSEKLAYNFMLDHYMQVNDQASVKALKKFNNLRTENDLISFFNSAVRDDLMHQLGIGTMRNMHSLFKDIFLPVWKCRAYTLKEKYIIWKSKIMFLPKSKIKTEALMTDFASAYPEVKVPVYFFCGKYDLTVNIDITKNYYNTLNAPLKAFYTFKSSAHGPLFEEPARFMEIVVKDVLNQSAGLSDEATTSISEGHHINEH